MKKKTILLDGATGTRLWELATAAGFDRTPTWRYNLEHPELVEQVAREYVAAGSDVICSNTFAANRLELHHYADRPDVGETVAAGVRIAKRAAEGTGVRVALDVGPLNTMLEPYGELSEEGAVSNYAEVLEAGMSEDPAYIFFETFTSLDMLRTAMKATAPYLGRVPVLCSMSFQRSGMTFMGDSVPQIAKTVEELGASAVGLNCSFGPAASLPVIRAFAEHTGLPLIVKPNVDAGCDADRFAAEISQVLELVTYAGACCGSDASYIAKLRALL